MSCSSVCSPFREVVCALGRNPVVARIVVVFVLDITARTILVLGQTRLFALPGEMRSRLNTSIVVRNFLGGAIGSSSTGPL